MQKKFNVTRKRKIQNLNEMLGGGQSLERQIFRNFKITNIKITKSELFHSFIFEFIFSLFINYLNNL